MTKDNKIVDGKPKRVKRISPQRAQFQGELSILNQAMRLALEKYIAHNKKKNIRVTYAELSRVTGVSDSYMYSLKYGSCDISTQVVAQILLRTPEIKPFFTKAYDSIIKKGGCRGGLLDGIMGGNGGESIDEPMDEFDALKKKLSDANEKIKELNAIIETKDYFIEKLLARVRVLA